jgi:glycosyltransferase A (GT-A) superfamily protein (DUF2064 family)
LTGRVVAVLAATGSDALSLAMLEDVVDLVEAMREVQAALAVPGDAPPAVTDVTWPGMPVVSVPAGARVSAVLDTLPAVGADEGGVVCADAPDLPALLLGKLHSALTGAEVAVCPADGGGLVALAARLPVPGWLAAADVRLDDAKALAVLRAAAPRRALHVGPGWHRIRTTEDQARLDPGLEGWDATRALLGR